jgi:hypothetical protein
LRLIREPKKLKFDLTNPDIPFYLLFHNENLIQQQMGNRPFLTIVARGNKVKKEGREKPTKDKLKMRLDGTYMRR